ncbi:MAG: hypothetical protein ACHBN1_13980 [Heteroscytonema crispum UTEX LB 1556]
MYPRAVLLHHQPLTTRLLTTNHQPQRGSPVAWVGKPYLWARSSPGGIFPTADASAPSPPTN